jgi:hypothetical protein
MLSLFCTQSYAQFYETKPHFLSIGGGVSRNNFVDSKQMGYFGKVEAAYFFHYLFGAGLKVDYTYFDALPNIFADSLKTRPPINYNRTTTNVNQYIVRNYTANAYFNAMPTWWFSFMISVGAGFQVLTTPSGTVLYEEVYPYNSYGNPSPKQTALVEVKEEKYRPVVFHAGLKTNFMFNENFGMNVFGDYYFSKNVNFLKEQHHQFSGGIGLIFMLPEEY